MVYDSRLLTVILILDVTQFILTDWAIDDDGCRTPNKGVGSCIPIKQCQPILEIMLQVIPVPEYIANELQRYKCGFTKTSVKVCCPYDSESLDYLLRKPSATETSARFDDQNSIFDHRNLNLLPEKCGTLQSSVKIIHGTETDLFEFPWMALLSYKKGQEIEFKCAGTILNEWYILTAAHCITNLNQLKLIGVRVGEYNVSSPIDCVEFFPDDVICAERVQDIPIDKVIPHPHFDPSTQANDIGLIRLATPINMTVDSILPICLPVTKEETNKNFSGTVFIVTGWGFKETAKKSEVLLKVHVPTINQEDCQKAYQKTYQHSSIQISDNQICAGGIKGDSCGGDSGGPLQYITELRNEVRYIQHGIVSFGPKFCGLTDIPGVYTRVDRYMDWILSSLQP